MTLLRYGSCNHLIQNQILDKVSGVWEKLKTLTIDIAVAQEECIIDMYHYLPQQSSLPHVRATFFNYKQKRRFVVLFAFADLLGQIVYPEGKWNWSFKNVYGDVT